MSLKYHPPIVEAIFMIECDPSLDSTLLAQSFSENFRKAYPEYTKFEVNEISQTFSLDKNKTITESSDMLHEMTNHSVGFEVLSEDKKQIAHFQQGSFSFHRLEPYSNFDDYFPDIKKLWEIYIKLAKPTVVTKISMRYINRLALPFEKNLSLPLGEYFNIAPSNLSAFPLKFAGVFQSLRMLCPDSKSCLQLTLASEDRAKDTLPFILDIEAFKPLNAKPESLERFAKSIDQLRHLKNQAFQTTLTDKCQNLFQQ